VRGVKNCGVKKLILKISIKTRNVVTIKTLRLSY